VGETKKLKRLRAKIAKRVEDREQDLIDLCCRLIQAKGENPPGDVSKVASVAEHFLQNEMKRLRDQEARLGCLKTKNCLETLV